MRFIGTIIAVSVCAALFASGAIADSSPTDSGQPPLINMVSPPPDIVTPQHEAGQKLGVPYPPLARRLDEQGRILVLFTVREDGTVSDVSTEKSSGFADLDDAAVESVKHWRYKPALKDGKPIAVRLETYVKFQLTNPDAVPDGIAHVDVNLAAADYPREAIVAREEGTVYVSVTITEDGTLQWVKVVRSSGSRYLDQASFLLAMKHWHFAAATMDGKLIASSTLLVFNWHLPPMPPPTKH